MRVLDTYTGQFVEKDPSDIEYAILSHTWDSKGEQTSKQLKKIQKRYDPGSQPSTPQRDPPPPVENHQDGLLSTPSLSHPSLTPSSGGFMARSSVSTPDVGPTAQSETPLSPIWEDRDLSPKIRDACATARANGYRYLWIDSCCIDKSSSSELSEAINSMYTASMAHCSFMTSLYRSHTGRCKDTPVWDAPHDLLLQTSERAVALTIKRRHVDVEDP